MLRTILLAGAACSLMAGAAAAADLPRRAAPPPVFVPVPVFTWTGFYAGVNAGYGFDVGRNDRYALPAASVLNSFGTNGVLVARGINEREGFVGGAQIGYNYQFTPGSGVVVGVEADAQYSDFGRGARTITGTYFGDNGPPEVNNRIRVLDDRLNYFGTVRGRLGYAFDRVLVYGTGGFAYGEGRIGGDAFRTGWAAGGGVEYALPTDSVLNVFRSSAVTLKLEGLYVHLDRDNAVRGRSVWNPNTFAFSFNAPARDSDFVVARAGLNYKFNSY